MQKPAPKELNKPSGKLRTSHISIKKMLTPTVEDLEKPDMANMPYDAFSFEDFKIFWRRFAFDVKNQGKENFYSALTRREPRQKDEFIFIMEVDNEVQIDIIKPLLADLIEYLRAKLKNYSITVRTEVTNTPEEDTKFLTGKDKFASLARKNPNLHALKKRFNLDIEF